MILDLPSSILIPILMVIWKPSFVSTKSPAFQGTRCSSAAICLCFCATRSFCCCAKEPVVCQAKGAEGGMDGMAGKTWNVHEMMGKSCVNHSQVCLSIPSFILICQLQKSQLPPRAMFFSSANFSLPRTFRPASSICFWYLRGRCQSQRIKHHGVFHIDLSQNIIGGFHKWGVPLNHPF